jgi:VCBS repeat protein/FG-GAP repeat protein
MREVRCNSLFSVGLLSILALMAAATSAAAPASPARFARAVLYSAGGDFSSSVALGDLNGDGHLDAVVTNLCQTNPYDCSVGIVGVLLDKGDGTFQSPIIYSRTGNAGSAVIADVNGDGKLDLVTLTGNGTASFASVMLGNGDGTFQNLVNYDAGGYGPGSLAVADVNGDGHPDIVVGNELKWGDPETGEVAVLLGNGDGTFQPPVMYNCSGSGGFVAIRDLNGDGKPDLVVTASGSISVLLGYGDGTFQAAVSYDSGGPGGGAVAVEDVNGDGKLDTAVANGSPTVGFCWERATAPFRHLSSTIRVCPRRCVLNPLRLET